MLPQRGPAYFNSRPCVRGDLEKDVFLHPEKYFNSRPCVRGDGYRQNQTYVLLYNFNSRPCVRGDADILWLCNNFVISIRAPA